MCLAVPLQAREYLLKSPCAGLVYREGDRSKVMRLNRFGKVLPYGLPSEVERLAWKAEGRALEDHAATTRGLGCVGEVDDGVC